MKNLEKKITLKLIQAFLFVLPGFFLIFGCSKDWLEEKPDKRIAVPQTVTELQAILDNVGVVNSQPSSLTINEVSADGHYFTDQVFDAMAGTRGEFQNAYAWTSIQSYNILSSYATWYFQSYATISKLNVILEAKLRDNDKNEFEHVIAQALFNRARIFYNLLQTYAPPYGQTTADADLGIALRLNTDITEQSKRSTVRQVYEQIIGDLKTALNSLPNQAAFITRASKPAASGLLAKVYLTMGDYVNAFTYANEYLKIKSELLEYSTIPVLNPTIGINKEISFLEYMNSPSQLTSQYLIDQDLYDSYNINDLRKTVFFKATSTGITFKGQYSINSSHNFTGISTDEIYLIRSECYARMGDFAKSMKDLNDLLRTRWAKNTDGSTKYIDQTASNELEALSKIFAERKKQLILRGVRWTDLRRFNLDPRFAVTLTRTIGGAVYTIQPNSYQYTFPLPIEAIQRSTMPQNPGWQ